LLGDYRFSSSSFSASPWKLSFALKGELVKPILLLRLYNGSPSSSSFISSFPKV
jgi:hypothetical protein